jgi:Ca-activated chloride channel family protein
MDYGAAKLFVPDIETDMISDQGTNIGSALDEALTQFKDEESGRAILVITDGEDHERKWQNALPELRKKEVVMAFLGLGTENGGLVPEDPYDATAGYKKQNGSPVRSQLDPATIRSMAQATGAEAIVSSSSFPDMSGIASLFSNAKNRKIKSLEFQVDKHYYQLAVIAAICCLVMYLFNPFIVNRKRA